jgi:hypothetical protein
VTSSTLAWRGLLYAQRTPGESRMNLLGSLVTAGCVLLLSACCGSKEGTGTGTTISISNKELPTDPAFCETLHDQPGECHLCGPAARSFLQVPGATRESCETWAKTNHCTAHFSSDICNIQCPPLLQCPDWPETRCNPCAGGPGGVWTPSGCDGTTCANSAPGGCSGRCFSSRCRVSCP